MRYSVSVKFHKDFVEVGEDTITVGIMAKPQKGKANEEVIKKIVEHFHVARSRVRITSGMHLKKKIVEIEDED